ncbi:acetylglutamate kinase [Robertkochia marina]|uniref:Acetylglutamate kinase n=1 Tax=Robertkochia marina TaxID=1227945 RepID=A0A4S3M003_9FLAO|nr:acetylglutamate kinase [Robertkochia marina]THD67661.1 acetylglutamate kinase [Robertkochia marina]TRZ43393.1 acetylglutamate kinase [Robertkochia marina]
MQELSIVKIGGNVIENPFLLNGFLKSLAKMPGRKLLVHGGGKLASETAGKMGIPVKMHQGRRITCEETLKVVTMVYAGYVNKNITAALQAEGCNAIGMSGADMNIITAEKRRVTTIDYGFAGDITRVNVTQLNLLLEAQVTPVFCAVTHDGNGQLLNTNADTIAAAMAGALSSEWRTRLYYCFEKKGVLKEVSDENSVIPEITPTYFETLKASGIIADGMLPKLHNAFDALKNGVDEVMIGSHEMIENTTVNHTKIFL